MVIGDLAGRYSLVSHGVYDRNSHFIPTSSYLLGELIYSADGNLSVLIFFKEAINSEKDFLAYTGRVELISVNEVIHHISICSQIKRNGTNENRTLEVTGEGIKLGLSMENEERFEAVWKKIDSAV